MRGGDSFGGQYLFERNHRICDKQAGFPMTLGTAAASIFNFKKHTSFYFIIRIIKSYKENRMILFWTCLQEYNFSMNIL